jgi:hypothetical protein
MQATIGAAAHPSFGPSATPYISRPSPRLAVTNPGTSNRPAAGWSWSATSVTNRPPMTGPTAGARAVGMTRMADARTHAHRGFLTDYAG